MNDIEIAQLHVDIGHTVIACSRNTLICFYPQDNERMAVYSGQYELGMSSKKLSEWVVDPGEFKVLEIKGVYIEEAA